MKKLIKRFWWPSLWREITYEKKMRENANLDWAEDYIYLQKLCLEVGYSEREVYGDSFGVPGIMDLADLLRKKIPNEK